MVNIIDTRNRNSILTLSPDEQHWVYNGLDVVITAEIYHALSEQIDPVARKTYEQAKTWLAPFMDMMLTGLNVDIKNRERLRRQLTGDFKQVSSNLQRLVTEGIGLHVEFNARSPAQVKELLYERLRIPEIKKRNSKGAYVPSSAREVLEKLAMQYISAAPIIAHILKIRDLGKALGFLKTPIDDDGKIRCSFNLAGTNTGRLSSQISDFGTGTNLQNVDTQLRYMFIPEKGRKFVNVDLGQADARNVGAIAWNMFVDSHGEEFAGAYLDACESGDLHTTVCNMAWPDLDWPEAREGWRAIADQLAYRELSYRALAKKLGHGTNYLGQPPVMAIHTKVQRHIIEEFQAAYFAAFPCLPAWQAETTRLMQETGVLTNLFGRRRMFFGRRDSRDVINAAIAYSPQGSTGEEINHGIAALWNHKHGKYFRLHVQVHDSILFSIPEEAEAELVPLALQLMRIPLTLARGRQFIVPLDAHTGWNWGYAGESNYYGLRSWNGETDDRSPPSKLTHTSLSLLDAL